MPHLSFRSVASGWILCASTTLASLATAGPLDPLAFPSLGPMPPDGFQLDTDALTLDGMPVGSAFDPDGGGPALEIAVFTFDGGAVLDPGALVTATGTRPVALLIRGDALLSGVIDVSGSAASATSGGAGGPAGHRGGNGMFCATGEDGHGPGGGDGGLASCGQGFPGAGGGHGGAGANVDATVLGGAAYGDPLVSLEGGSGGGAGGGSCACVSSTGGGGGGGGGALEIAAVGALRLRGASVLADGGSGGIPTASSGIGGGGAGGAILIHAYEVHFEWGTLVRASGGTSSSGAWSGGGGRITVVSHPDGVFCDQTYDSYFAAPGANPGVIDLRTDSGVGSPPAGPTSTPPLDPDAFASLGPLPAGNLVIDTDALTVSGVPGGLKLTQGGCLPEIAVFTFDGGSQLATGATLAVVGRRPLALLFQGEAQLAGTIDIAGSAGAEGSLGGAAGIPGPGGRPGGMASALTPATAGLGVGGGAPGAGSAGSAGGGGGGGGGFGGDGLDGASGTAPGGAGGSAHSQLSLLESPSGGGGGGAGLSDLFVPQPGGGGGGGGGSLEIAAVSQLSLVGASVLADGGAGGAGTAGSLAGGGGGGAGGHVLLHACSVSLDAATTLLARGGAGGGAGAPRSGGAGGGGHVRVLVPDLDRFEDATAPGAVDVSGGGGSGGSALGIFQAEADASVCPPAVPGLGRSGVAILLVLLLTSAVAIGRLAAARRGSLRPT